MIPKLWQHTKVLCTVSDSGDGHSTASSSTPTAQIRERSHTGGSNSIELEWDHDEGMGQLFTFTSVNKCEFTVCYKHTSI